LSSPGYAFLAPGFGECTPMRLAHSRKLLMH
jgi:hypothetical protein